jgi:hypothetical protein
VFSPGFKRTTQEVDNDDAHGTALDQILTVGGTEESITVTAEVSRLNTMNAEISSSKSVPSPREVQAQQDRAKDTEQSANVGELQRKVVGVLPIAINIPRTGNSYRFVRPLVVDEETKLTFRYRRK